MAWHAYRADMRIKTIDTGKRVRSHCSYLVNTVELCFYNTLEIVLSIKMSKGSKERWGPTLGVQSSNW